MSDPFTNAPPTITAVAEGHRTPTRATIVPPAAAAGETAADPRRSRPPSADARAAPKTREESAAPAPARRAPSDAELLAIATRARVLLRAAYAGLTQSVVAEQSARSAGSDARRRDASIDERAMKD